MVGLTTGTAFGAGHVLHILTAHISCYVHTECEFNPNSVDQFPEFGLVISD
jgi:hypothetical protein